MRTLGVITARGGSKRLPKKNVRTLKGKPLVAWVIEAASRSSRLSRFVVSSDDEDVLEIASAYDKRFALRRPDELATDEASSASAALHALHELEARGEGPFDAIAILQPTSPFTLPDDIDGTIELLERTGADSAVSICEARHLHPAKFKLLGHDQRLTAYLEDDRDRMAYQQLQVVYLRNGSIYASRRRVIEAGQSIGDDCRGYPMPASRSVDIDDEMDWKFAEFLARSL